MKSFLSKYWLYLLVIGMTVLFIFYNDEENSNYLAADNEHISSTVFKIVIVLLAVLYAAMVFLIIKGRVKLKQMPSALFGGFALIGGMYFFLYPFITSSIYFVNRMIVRGAVEKQYIVRYVSNNPNDFYLCDARSGRSVRKNINEIGESASILKEGEKLTLVYQRGILNYLFDPKLK